MFFYILSEFGVKFCYTIFLLYLYSYFKTVLYYHNPLSIDSIKTYKHLTYILQYSSGKGTYLKKLHTDV